MKLVFASNNKHKLDGACQILPIGVDVLSLQDVGFLQEIEETGATLEENSAIKARVVWQWLLDNALLDGIDGVFADDTGLEIKSLNGAPGVRAARWASEDAIDINNRQKALLELQGIEDRFARFRTVVSLILGGKLEQVEGIVNGRIALAEMGDGGFGYDPVFIPEGYDVTFACLSAEEKNKISQRVKAMAELRKILEKL